MFTSANILIKGKKSKKPCHGRLDEVTTYEAV